jgi:hypothetical protein
MHTMISKEDAGGGSSLQVTGNNLVIALPVRPETAWARMSESFRDVIKEKRGHFGGFVLLKGSIDGEDIEVQYSSITRGTSTYLMKGTLSRTPQGSQLTLTIKDDRQLRIMKTLVFLIAIAAVGALFAGLSQAPSVVVWMLGGAAVGMTYGLAKYVAGYRNKHAALKGAAEILRRIAVGQLDE